MAKTPRTGITEEKIEQWAEDLGRVLGTARAKADSWLGQRQEIAKHLTEIRDTATNLLAQLTGGAATRGGRRGRQAGPTNAAGAAGAPRRRKRRKMSAEARERIAEAQRKRWAAHRAKSKKA